MGNRTLTVTPGSGATINTLPDVGQQDAADSLPVVIARDQSALPVTTDKLPASLGPKAKAVALAVTFAIDDPVLAAIVATGPGTDGFAVTPSDTVAFPAIARSLYVGVAGDVAVVTPSGTVLLHRNVPTGAYLPILAQRVDQTGTTATGILGYV